MRPAARTLLMGAGFLSLGLGLAGVLLPLLPTTPFLLLAAACFARSSQRFHLWLTANRLFGRHLADYQSGRGVPPGLKLASITVLWLALIVSAIALYRLTWLMPLLALVGIAVTVHIAFIKTKRV
jgi:hypothetical protein